MIHFTLILMSVLCLSQRGLSDEIPVPPQSGPRRTYLEGKAILRSKCLLCHYAPDGNEKTFATLEDVKKYRNLMLHQLLVGHPDGGSFQKTRDGLRLIQWLGYGIEFSKVD